MRSSCWFVVEERPADGSDRTTVDGGCEVKNLDFTSEGRCATLAS
jgi:hypothetical protein